ncbi:hypothetical protein A2973_03770 [Candidatus Gottesmanbacteria bacterium RIFCSPLOWO2_01_FULL_49_10]|uniref:Glycosyltransferase RgtA/B/C/D-like domain-containing protein n=1 Tax=Candidatus Gottesmanbacteria bacterium RIFCSPLOWO2_01_FULL_49_10 TaxID=1798396 RepID=A0A1F6B0G6_9BACT|nr:MAG: hypothetical protein UY10_C0005G0013 [Microgenomates group bacterium GW2011_GWA2_47_8]OGG30411.1 MAG: hypothetical protein A2973_03770 [Candidatus Gottesmanbacteria bacterium RIFCSPLOWO2_01_FULL_49_10]
MKRFTDYFSRERIFIGSVAIAVAILNQLHVIIQWVANRPGFVFTGIAHYFADYFLYVAQMVEGARGSLLYYHRFTNEPVAPTWIYWFNALLGRLGYLVGISPFATYNIALFVLVMVSMLLTYALIRRVFPTNRYHRYTALLISITASPFLDFQVLLREKALRLPDLLWFSPNPAFNRYGGVPHQVFQTILYLALCIIYGGTLENTKQAHVRDFIAKNYWRYLSLISLTVLGTTASPVQMLVFLIGATSTTLFAIVYQKKLDWSHLLTLVVMGLVALPAAWLTNREFSETVFAVGKIWELSQYVDTSAVHFLIALGISGVYIPFGIIPILRKGKPLPILLFFYAISSILLFFSPIPKLLGTTPVRYLHPASYTGLWILATTGMIVLTQKIKHVFGKAVSSRLVCISLLGLYILFTLPSYIIQIQARIDPKTNPNLLMDTRYNHVPKTVSDTLLALGGLPTNPNYPVVLVDSTDRIEILVPVFADKIVFTGHPVHTLYSDTKELLRSQFFSGAIYGEEAVTFLNAHRIGFILLGTQNHAVSLPQSLFTKVFTNEEFTIYERER